MQVIKNLNVLNDYMENQKLLTKLPDWLVSRWNRETTRKMKEEKKHPDFKTFTTFISAEADLLCNPISSCHAVKELERAKDSLTRNQNRKTKRKGLFITPRRQKKVQRSQTELQGCNCNVHSAKRLAIC